MVRATLFLSLLLSGLLLAGLHTMEDPQPWVKAQAPEPAPSVQLNPS